MMARILLINDEPDLLYLYKVALEQVGHVVETLTDDTQVLATIRRFQPDVIGLDWIIPATSGEAVLRALKANPETCSIPVFVMSALEGLDVHAPRLGAEAVLHKPFGMRELRDAVDRLLRADVRASARQRR